MSCVGIVLGRAHRLISSCIHRTRSRTCFPARCTCSRTGPRTRTIGRSTCLRTCTNRSRRSRMCTSQRSGKCQRSNLLPCWRSRTCSSHHSPTANCRFRNLSRSCRIRKPTPCTARPDCIPRRPCRWWCTVRLVRPCPRGSPRVPCPRRRGELSSTLLVYRGRAGSSSPPGPMKSCLCFHSPSGRTCGTPAHGLIKRRGA